MTAPARPAPGGSAWPLLIAAAAILTITMGVRQSLGLFVSPLNTATGLGVVSISFALAVADADGERDTVAFTDPGYPVYERGALFAHARPLAVPLREEHGFLPDLDAIDEETWSRLAIFWVNYPNNPTCATAPLAFYEQLAALAREHGFVVASDEEADLDAVSAELRAAAEQHGLAVLLAQRGRNLPGNLRGHEHFGFKDGVSQPGIRGERLPGGRGVHHGQGGEQSDGHGAGDPGHAGVFQEPGGDEVAHQLPGVGQHAGHEDPEPEIHWPASAA